MIGIYQIKNRYNDRLYIGSSKDIDKRWYLHKTSLIKNRHHSIKLQEDWNKYGEESFEFSVIEECSKSNLLQRENYWIDFYDCFSKGYNINPFTKQDKLQETNIIMDCVINYRKLRIILMDRKLKPSFVCKEVGLSHNVGRKIMNDENVEVLSLAKICLYLGITLDEAIDFTTLHKE